MGRSYTRSVSTTWEWRKVKIERAAGPQVASAPQARRRSKAPGPFDRRTKTVQVRWRGGAEAHWGLNDGRGWIFVPGHECIHDVLAELLATDP